MEVRTEAQAARQTEAPGVVLAGHERGLRPVLGHQLGAPVRTDVIEHANQIGLVTDDDQRIAAHLGDRDVAGVWHLAQAASKNPVPLKQGPVLQLEESRRDKGLVGEPARLFDRAGHGVKDGLRERCGHRLHSKPIRHRLGDLGIDIYSI